MSRIRFLLPLAGLWLASPVFATDLAYVKCAVNQDRVWVYESLNSFDVEARLKCGEPVEILLRVKGYVKIRTESGVEGYVPDSAFPDLPAIPDDADKPAAAAAANRSVAAAAAAKATPTPAPTPSAVPAKPAPATVAAAKLAPAEPVASQPVAITITPVAAPQPAAPPPVIAAAHPAPVKVSATAKSGTSTSAPGHGATQQKVSTASTHTKPVPTMAKKASPAPSTSSPDFDSAPAARLVHSAPVASPSGLASAKASVEIVSARKDSAVARVEESEDYPDTEVQNESADPACHVFFAAYGLSPSQYKWMAENRRKEFSGICPAPDLAHVDFVVLFTHDSDSYAYAMPQPVHTDHNGFSDFSPLTTVDTALVKASDVEKARYEFVWVFRMNRGAFDPAKFSPRRRPQFTTYVKGSRAPARAAEDAFNFVETQGVNR